MLPRAAAGRRLVRMPVGTTLGLASVAALALGVGPAALADSGTLSDSSGDVARSHDGSAVPTASGDVTGVRAIHGSRDIRIVAQYRRLDRRDRAFVQFFVVVHGDYNAAAVRTTPARPGGRVGLGNDGGTVECAGLSHRVRHDLDRISVRIPRACLGSPRSVRFGLVSTTGGRFVDVAGAGAGVTGPVLSHPVRAGHVASTTTWTTWRQGQGARTTTPPDARSGS